MANEKSPKVIGFKIWYSDKVIQGKTHRKWVNAPDEDVQAVLLFFDKETNHLGHKYRRIATGSNFYSLTKDMRLLQGNNKTKPTEGHIKKGKWTDDDNLARIEKEAIEDQGYGLVLEDVHVTKAGQ